MHSAAKSIHGRLVEMLISYSSVPLDVNSRNLIGVTPLHIAALNNTEACSMLLKYNADVNSTTNLGYTPLQYATKHGQYKACKWLYILESTTLRADQCIILIKNRILTGKIVIKRLPYISPLTLAMGPL